jgi:hypothetical protein
MEIILYATAESKTGYRLETILKEIIPCHAIIRIQSMHHFEKSIIENHAEFPIVISVIERPKEFIALYSILDKNQTIHHIIVCEDKEETIALAHELRPRFIAHGNELSKVKAVVEKMLHSSH